MDVKEFWMWVPEDDDEISSAKRKDPNQDIEEMINQYSHRKRKNKKEIEISEEKSRRHYDYTMNPAYSHLLSNVHNSIDD
ncbi:hypothetical protein V4D30_01570 [Thermodesulfovibrio sp. 3907-1M]|uniref:Uncharacterized protein n=1 Tax=Thermodesulfovibrio autotrophicus TaxID=3118333 RepID=A0AAU8GX90_9BACT